MTSSTTPQDRAVELIRKFIVTNVGYDAGHLMTVQAQELTILLGDAGLLSSGTQEEEDQDGSLRSTPSAGGTRLPEGVAEVLGYVSRGRGYVGCEPYPDATARRVLAEPAHCHDFATGETYHVDARKPPCQTQVPRR